MALDATDLRWLRRKIGGTPPDDDELNALFDEIGTLAGVARSVIDERLANLLASPTSVTVAGEYTVDTSKQIAALQKQLSTDSDLAAEGPTPNQVRFVAPAPRRHR